MIINRSHGYIYAALAAMFWAVSGTSAKFLFNHGLTPPELVQLRITIATVVVFLGMVIWNRALPRIAKKDILYFAILGSLGLASVQFTYLFTISKIHVAAAILLQYFAPVFIAAFSVTFGKEKLTPRMLLSLTGGTIGCYLAVGAYNLNMLNLNIVGIISGILAAVAFAWYSIQGEYGMKNYDPWTVLFFAMLFAAISWNVLYPPFKAFTRPYSQVEWILILYIAIFGTAVPFGLYFKSISLIRATRASITSTLEPIAAGAISYIFLGEKMEALQILGGALVIGSIILLQIKGEQDT